MDYLQGTLTGSYQEQLVRDEVILHHVKEWAITNPAWSLLGIKVEDAGENWALLRLPFQKSLLQTVGTVHGGFLATLLDSATGAALTPVLGENEYIVTVDLKINYIRAVRDSDVLALARVKHRGLTTSLVECTLFDANQEKQIAFGTTLFMVLRKKHV